MLKFIRNFLFGQRAQGELLSPPTIKTIYPNQKLEEDQWRLEVKFGSRYGHRGSFYQPNF